MKAIEIESAVFELEQVRIVIRCPAGAHLGDYNYERRAAGNSSVSEWLQQRIIPLLNGNEVTVINGHGEIPHGRTRMERLRQTYAEA